MSLDTLSAWAELARFAAVADLELDERSHPDYDSKTDDTAEELKAEEESEPSDYKELFRALESGHITIAENGALTVNWRKPPHKGKATMVLDPDQDGDGWNYSKAIRALHSVPIAPAVSKAARKRMGSAQEEDDRLGRMDRFLEILGDEPKDTMIELRNRRDREIVTTLSNFILLESQRSR